jgi:hypothetical protein
MTNAAKDLNSFKLTMTNDGLVAKNFDFIREQALCFYSPEAMTVSDHVRSFAKFIGNQNVSVTYSMETVNDNEMGRMVVEEVAVGVVPDYYGADAIIRCELNFTDRRSAARSELPELRREGFWTMFSKFTDANNRRVYLGKEITVDDKTETKAYDFIAAAHHLRNLFSAIPLSNYKLYADLSPDGVLTLELWSLDGKFALTTTVVPANARLEVDHEEIVEAATQ